MSKATRRSSLLYLEDQPESLALAAAFLAARKDLTLLHAPELDSFIKLARSERPEVLLVNLDLAAPPPRELMKRLRAEPGLQDTPVLGLGAEAKPSAVTQAVEAGMFVYLVKPLQHQSFMEVLAFALEFVAAERAEQI